MAAMTYSRSRALAACLSLVSLPATAFAQADAPTAAPPAELANSPLSEGYVLGPGDVIEVSVLGRDEFKPRVQVQVDGTVQLPYLRSVEAANLTVLQLRDRVSRMLEDGGYYVDPAVNVAVVSYASRYVTVLGEFATPGIVPVDRAYRVSEILARVGGARQTAGDEVFLRRANGQELRLPLTAIASGGPEQDPFVEPGDKLYLAEAPQFYVYGQVGAPGTYRIERGMTVRMALARSGGLTDRGSAKKIALYRGDTKVKATLDTLIGPDDTLYVGERFF